jgi:hypothetical protein
MRADEDGDQVWTAKREFLKVSANTRFVGVHTGTREPVVNLFSI